MAGPGTDAFDPIEAAIAVAQRFVAHTLTASYLVGRNGHTIAASATGARLVGSSPDELVRRDITTLIAAEYRQDARELVQTALATSTPRITDLALPGTSPESLWVQCAVVPVVTTTGFVAGAIVTLTPTSPNLGGPEGDHALRRQATLAELGRVALERRSLRSLEQVAVQSATAALDANAAGIFRLTRTQCRIRRAPKTPRSWWEAPADERSGDSVLAFAVRAERNLLSNDLAHDARFTPNAWLADYRSVMVVLVRANGRIIGGLVAARYTADAFTSEDLHTAESIAAILGAAAERTEATYTRSSRGQQIGLAFESVAAGTWAWNPTTDEMWLSPEAEAMIGLTPGTFTGTRASLYELLGGSVTVLDTTAEQARARMTGTGSLNIRFLDEHGAVHWIESRGRALDPEDPDSEWIGFWFDVTDRNRLLSDRLFAEEETRQARNDASRAAEEARMADERLHHLVDDAPVGFAVWDRELRCLTMNTTFAEISSTSVQESVGRTFAETTPQLWDRLQPALEAARDHGVAGNHVEITAQLVNDPRHLRTWMFKLFPTRVDRAITEVGTVAIDISEQKRAEQLERLLRGTTVIFAYPSIAPSDVLRHVIYVPIPDFADVAIVAFHDPITDAVLAFGAARDTPTGPAHSLPVDQHSAQSLIHRATGFTEDGVQHWTNENPEHSELLGAFGIHTAVIAPIVADGSRPGLMILGYSDVSNRDYEPRDHALVNELAHRAGELIAAAILRTQVERAHARVELLANLGELTSSDTLTDLNLELLNDVLVPRFADLCMSFVLREGVFQKVAARAVDPGLQHWLDTSFEPVFPMSDDSPSADAIAAGGAILIDCAEALAQPDRYVEPIRTFMAETRIGSLLVVPIVGAGQHIGTLICAMTERRHHFTAEDIQFAPELGRRIAPIIEGAQRLERARAHTEALQRSLLPSALPNVFGYELAAQYRAAESELRVGGDWYDAIELTDRSVLLVIGDVTGHGAFAAALTGQLRTALRIAVLDTSNVDLLLERLDRFVDGLDDFEMATALLVRIDRDTGEFTWASAGHPPPLIRRANDQAVFLEGRAGPPLGAVHQPEYERHHDKLDVDDCLILFTDGLVERREERIDDGLGRLASFVHANRPDERDLHACALGLMDAQIEGRAPEDDIALLVVHRSLGVSDHAFQIDNNKDSIRVARHEIERYLTEQHVARRDIEELLLVASELCANAMEHGSIDPLEPILIRCAISDTEVELAVEDTGTWVTTGPRHGGRGLQIVRTLSDTVDVTRTDPGTRVTVRRSVTLEPA